MEKAGLREGWYRVNCPLRYVVFEPEEGALAGVCGMHTGPREIGGMTVLCIRGAMMMSQTVAGTEKYGRNAIRICSDLPAPVGVPGRWVLPNVRDWELAWHNLGASGYLHCDGCRLWDPQCCSPTRWHTPNIFYWTSDTYREFIVFRWGIYFQVGGLNPGRVKRGGENVYIFPDVRCIFVGRLP